MKQMLSDRDVLVLCHDIVREELIENPAPQDYLKSLQMWCYNDTLHKEKPDTYRDEGCCLTHTVGLPTHPATGEEMPLTPYQVEFIEAVFAAVANPGGISDLEWKRIAHKFHLSKGRQMGFTEIVLRLIQYFCFSRYAGRNVGIMAATNGKLAAKDLRRFAKLFRHIPYAVASPLKNNRMVLYNDTVVEAFPATEEAMTGDTKYACVYMDEAAKWRLVDDQPVFNSVMPIVNTNGADLYLVSTFKGPVKMFYKIYREPEDFIMLQYDIWRTEGNLYTRPQIEYMLKHSKEDPDQEYLCKVTTAGNAIYGLMAEENITPGLTEWDISDDDEDDGYVEDDD